MRSYDTLRNALEMFSVQVGLEDDAARRVLVRALSNPEWRNRLESELVQVLDDPHAPWRALVANDEYELDEPATDEEARAIVLDVLWPTVFPNEPMPT